MVNVEERSSWPKMPLPAGTPLMSAFDGDLRAGLPVRRRAPVHLVVADPVPRAPLGRLRITVEVLLDRRRWSVTGTSNCTITGMPTPDGLAGERRERRVGLLVEGERAVLERGVRS